MSGWLQRYLKLQAQARTGLNSTVVAWAMVAAVGGVLTFGFVILTAAIWLAERYSPLTAALILGAFFLLVTIIALVASVIEHRRTVEQAKQALAVRSNAPWMNPQALAAGMQIGRAIGWRKLVPLIAVGVIAAGLTKEWFKDDKPATDGENTDEADETSDQRDAA